MDSLPPNDPNRNGGGNNNNNHSQQPPAGKEAPFDGRNGRGQRDRANPGEPMDVLGNMQDSPVVVAMFLFGLLHWIMRERCIC
jgi:hypothetical protein